MRHRTRPYQLQPTRPSRLKPLVAALVIVALAGCGDSSDEASGTTAATAAAGGDEAAAPEETPSTPASAPSAPPATTTLPESNAEIVGTYERTATAEDGRAAGADGEFIETTLGGDGLVIRLELLADGTWNLLMDDCHCGTFVRGDFGTYTFDDNGRLVITSENTQSRGWSAVIDWTLDGDVLALTSAAGYRGDDGPFPLDPIETVMTLGHYTRIGTVGVGHAAPSIATTPGWESDLGPLLAELQERNEPEISFDLDFGWMDANAGEEVEQRIIIAVASGELDAGYVGVRALSALGVGGFDVLVAPQLVASYELQEAVLDSDIPDRLLPALDDLGVTGLAIAPGPMRYPLGIKRPYVRPDDFAGSIFHTFPATINTATAEALGAIHSQLWGGERDDAIDNGTIDVTENSLTWMNSNGRGAHVTLDALWPATAVLVANPDFLAGLSASQTDDLRSAIDDARRSASDLIAIEASMINELCKAGKQFVVSSDDELAAMRNALQPVYDAIAADPSAGTLLGEIDSLKQAVTAEPRSVPDGCG